MSFNHRTYPPKLYLHTPGYCRWCAKPILRTDGIINRKKTFCNKGCVGQYLLRADPKVMRQHVFFRDKGRCYDCGKVWTYLTDEWDADHIKPLYTAYGNLAFWEPENVVILCRKPCHQQKSYRDRMKYGDVRKLHPIEPAPKLTE